MWSLVFSVALIANDFEIFWYSCGYSYDLLGHVQDTRVELFIPHYFSTFSNSACLFPAKSAL
jgi:hypothetical protein